MKIFTPSIVCLLLFAPLLSFGQIGIDNDSPDPSAVLDLTATDKGVLIPRMTTQQREAIVSPANSLLVFDTSVNNYFYYLNNQWVPLNPWSAANSNIYVSTGNVGIGTATPSYKLDVNGPINTSGLYINGTAFSVDGTIPAGGIIMWSGSIASIPSGWALCNGSNGTPNLRDRFIVGAGSTYGIGVTGGAASMNLTVSQMPSHTHSGRTGLSGGHSHSIYGETMQKNGSSTVTIKVLDTGVDPNHGNYTENTSYQQDHYHDFNTNATGSNSPIDNRPPYYALAYIMKLP